MEKTTASGQTARKKKGEKITPEGLSEIRKAIREVDAARRNEELSTKERALLEASAVVLRDSERVAVEALEKEVVDGLEQAVEELKRQSRSLRARVTRINRTPKTLDHIEQALGYALTVFKSVSKWVLFFVLWMGVLSSCAVITPSQVKMVQSLAIASDTLTSSPSRLFENLSEVRSERSLLYAATLSSPEAHSREMASIVRFSLTDGNLAAKADNYIQVLNSYCRALQSLSNEVRWKQYGTELRGIGRRTDSLLIALNKTGWLEDELTIGWGKLTGRYTALLTETFMKGRQATAVKEYVQLSDTLVGMCVDSLIAILQSKPLQTLLANEQEALDDDYRAFLDAAARTSDYMGLALTADRTYVHLSTEMENTRLLRKRCITALRSFKKAHQRLSAQLSNRSDTSRDELAQSIFDDIILLNTLSNELAKLW